MASTSPRPFPSTLWTQVLAARDEDGTVYRDAMDRLVRLYWKPIYWTVRTRWNRQHEDARDLTQAFFAGLLEKDALSAVSPDRGRFRAWLRVVLDNFMRNEHAAANARKRGGDVTILSLNAADDPPPIPAGTLSPEKAFDRAWAIHLFHAAAEDLRAKLRSSGRDRVAGWFDRHELEADPPAAAALAAEAGVKPHEVENALKAARVEFAAILRARVQETLSDGAGIEEELRALGEALG